MRALDSGGTAGRPANMVERIVGGLVILYAGLIAFSADFARGSYEAPPQALLRLALTIVGVSLRPRST